MTEGKNPFPIDNVTATLEGLEETIIYKLVDRAQYSINSVVYEAGRSGFPGAENQSLFDLRLRFQEEMDSRFGRFAVPEERPWNETLPPPERSLLSNGFGFPIVDFNAVNQTHAILEAYLEFVTRLCVSGDDRQHGSAVELDVYAFQAISRRVHYGALYVAESKYLDYPGKYNALIRRKDTVGLANSLTRKEVEERILKRLNEKIEYIQKYVNEKVRRKIDPELVIDFYKRTVIPLTKEGEMKYLLNRPLIENVEQAV